MSSIPENGIAFAWQDARVVSFKGQFDTHIKTGDDYQQATLGSLWFMTPGDKPKGAGPAFIPSTYADYDAREHAAQRERGSYVALTGDVDGGDHSGEAIKSAVRAFAGNAAWLIYSSAHSRPGDRRWRIVLPLAAPQGFDTWHDAQESFFGFMEARGIEMDHALARAAQPVYLPNVPEIHGKSETRLRGDDGEPLYYEALAADIDAPGLAITEGAAAAGIATIRMKRVEDEQERDRIRREAEKRRASQPRGDGASIMEDFNAANSVATMFEICGYEQSPRSSEDWRSPHQTGETYATRVIGSKWVSLSASDTSARVGTPCKSGCYGDAYDLFVHYKHGGDHKAAYRALGQERRAAQGNVIYPAQFEPPQWMNEAPGYDEMPEWAADDSEPVIEPEMDRGEEPDIDGLLPLFDPADWTGTNPPERQWRWDSFIPDFQATLLTGAGAAGKSLATQQMCTCIALGLPFLGVPTSQAPALYITCEDDLQELHRRQEAICAALGVTLEATRGKLFLLSLQGEIGNELATFDGEGGLAIAPRYQQIEAVCLAKGIKHVTLDNTAHTFAGNENDRHEVAAFVNLNNRLAQIIGGSVVMVGHPNKAGDSYSGSTAWENQVRSRLYLEVPKNGDEGVPVDPDMRVLRNEKANYSQRGSEVTFFWFKGAFVLEDQMPRSNDGEMRESAQMVFENKVFMDLLDKLTEQQRQVSHAPNVSTYAPKVMAAMPEARGLNKGCLARAMERLFNLEMIAASQPLWLGRDRHPVLGLARKKA